MLKTQNTPMNYFPASYMVEGKPDDKAAESFVKDIPHW